MKIDIAGHTNWNELKAKIRKDNNFSTDEENNKKEQEELRIERKQERLRTEKEQNNFLKSSKSAEEFLSHSPDPSHVFRYIHEKGKKEEMELLIDYIIKNKSKNNKYISRNSYNFI